MKIELSFSDSERNLPYFKELSDYVSSLLMDIPDKLDVFINSMDNYYMEEAHVKKKAQKACSQGVCKSRRNKAVKK